MKEESEKPALGRPSKYEKKFDEMLIEHMSNGLSYQSFAAIVKVNIDTLYEWERNNASFSDAKKEAFSQNLLFWEKAGIEGLWSNDTSKFNSTLWIFNMKNRHKWVDRHEVKDISKEVEKMSYKELVSKIDELKKELEDE